MKAAGACLMVIGLAVGAYFLAFADDGSRALSAGANCGAPIVKFLDAGPQRARDDFSGNPLPVDECKKVAQGRVTRGAVLGGILLIGGMIMISTDKPPTIALTRGDRPKPPPTPDPPTGSA